MSRLGQHYRFAIENKTGQTLAANAVTIKPRRWKYGADGSITDEASGVADVLAQAATVLNAAFHTGTAQVNTTDKYIGGFFEVTVTAPASSSGDVIISIQRSVDGGTTWPDNALGAFADGINFTAAGTKRKTLRL